MTRVSVKSIQKIMSGEKRTIPSSPNRPRPQLQRQSGFNTSSCSLSGSFSESPYRSPKLGSGLSPSLSRLRKNTSTSSPIQTSSPKPVIPRVDILRGRGAGGRLSKSRDQSKLGMNSARFKKLKKIGSTGSLGRDEYKELIIAASADYKPFNFSVSLSLDVTSIDLTEDADEEVKVRSNKVKDMITPKPVDIVKTQLKVIETKEKLREERQSADQSQTVLALVYQEGDKEKEEILRKLEELRIKSKPKRDRFRNAEQAQIAEIR